MSISGVAAALIGLSIFFAVLSHGLGASDFPDVFFVQFALALTAGGVYFAWRYGASIVRSLRRDYLKQSFPNQPWLWRLDWSRRVSVDPTPKKNTTAWIATAWNLVATPLAVAGLYHSDTIESLLGISTLAVLTGATLFGYAMYRMWRRTLIDNPPLRIHTNPGRPGSAFECTLGTASFSADTQWSAQLVCLYSRLENAKGDSRNALRAVTKRKWHSSITPFVARSPRGTALALQFHVPADAPGTGTYENGHCRWVVRIEGVGNNGTPVFKHEYDVPMQCNAAQRATTAGVSTSSQQATTPPTTKPVPEMIGTLKAAGILFTSEGVFYPRELWDDAPLVRIHERINEISGNTFMGASLATILLASIGPWYLVIPLLMTAVAAAVAYVVTFYLRHHRYSVIFTPTGLVRQSRLFTGRWQKSISWSDIQSVVWRSALPTEDGDKQSTFRELVINPDDPATRLVLSPAMGNRDATEALVELLNVLAQHRSR